MSAWRKERELVLFGLLTAVAGIFAATLVSRNDWYTNVGFLVLGALIAIFTTLLSERIRRKTQVRDLARALHVELADRVARCCFDMEAPWHGWLDTANCRPDEVRSFRLRKFLPHEPVVFISSASQLGLLNDEAPQALVQFYYRLSAWRRDLENIAEENKGSPSGVDPASVRRLAKRLRQTLTPGLRALQAVGSLVDNAAAIEASAIGSYDESRHDIARTGTLRDRIQAVSV